MYLYILLNTLEKRLEKKYSKFEKNNLDFAQNDLVYCKHHTSYSEIMFVLLFIWDYLVSDLRF